MSYSLKNEYVCDIQSPTVQREIASAKAVADNFLQRYRMLKLGEDEFIQAAYQFAHKNGVLDQAANIRRLVFGNIMTTYGVSYISDSCVSGCTYCPIRRDARDTKHESVIKRRTLTVPEFIRDTEEILADGHTHICFLTGDGTLTYKHPENLIPYLQALNVMPLKEIILNVTPQTIEVFEKWRAAAPEKSMQFRVFQETYNQTVYAQKHPFGPKKGYHFRRESQDRAMQAGFDNYGFGVLLGLNPYFLQEIEAIDRHAAEMTAKWQKVPARICLPGANELAGIDNVEKQIYICPEAMELAYALMRLKRPESSIVSSERDTPELLARLDRYASNRTVDVQPSVGGNFAQLSVKGILLKQATVFPTAPDATSQRYADKGYVLTFDY